MIVSTNKRARDPLLGKEVLITGGPYKGHRGKVASLDDRQAIVELSAICKKLPFDKELIKDLSEVMKTHNSGVTT
jgi:transcription elongation factor